MPADSLDLVVRRLRSALPASPTPHEVVTVRADDLAALLAEMPCAACIWVQNVKDQAEVIRRLWDAAAR
jgi:hypothetical protein